MIQFKDITLKNWNDVAKSIIKSEAAYKEQIQSSYEDYNEIILAGDAIGKVGFLNGNYVGNVIGYPPTENEKNEFGVKKDNERYIYLFNFVIDEEYRGKGFGKIFVSEFLKESKKQGFTKVIGHFRQNGSLATIKKFGAKELSIYKNWEETEEDYVFCELDLDTFKF